MQNYVTLRNEYEVNMSIKLRLKLSDFMDTIIEETIMTRVAELHEISPVAFELSLWYKEGELQQGAVGHFLSRWESKMRNKTRVVPSEDVKFNESVFFNIIRKKDSNQKLNYRFEYVFSGHSDGILKGLDKFEHAIIFCYGDKVIRKQKRND